MLFYMSAQASYSHIYSYFLISLFVYLTLKQEDIKNFKPLLKPIYHISLGFILGLIFLVRNVNILIIIFWFLYGKEDFKNRFKKLFSPYIWITFFIVIMPQLLYWYHQSGQFIINSYSKPNTLCTSGYKAICFKDYFDWFSPHIIKNWFSYTKGLFFYYPVMVFCVFGLFKLKKYWQDIFNSTLYSLAPLIYLIVTWHMWWYGWSYGQRCYIDYMSIFSILIAISLSEVEKIKNSKVRLFLKIVFFGLIAIAFLMMVLVILGFCDKEGTLKFNI